MGMKELVSYVYDSGVMLYPINELDEQFYLEQGKPPSGKYAKMLVRAAPLANKAWDQTLVLKQSFHDLPFLSKFPITERSIYCYIENCVVVDLELQKLKKEVSTTKQEKELKEYYDEFDLDWNVFDLTFDDVEQFCSEQGHSLDISHLKQYYKEHMKKVKEERKNGC